MTYTVLFVPSAEISFLSLERDLKRRMAVAVKNLCHHPRPAGCVRLTGESDLYRIRVGSWRILYAIQDRELIVLVVKIGHRRDVYR